MLLRRFVQRVHFVGIGGAGMGAIAELLHEQGLQVTGSDAADGTMLRRLRSLGLRVHVGHDAAHLGEGAQAVQALVVSSAIAADNPELLAARARGLPVLPRAAMLAELMRGRLGVAVAGTHGKTTTTALVASVLMAGGAEPGYVIGGELLATGRNAGWGRGEVLVVEADESDASFLYLAPLVAVVTNIDEDHMATYGHSRARLLQAFADFVHRLPAYAPAVLCSDDPGVRELLPQLQRPLLRYGLGPEADVRAVDVQAGPGVQMRLAVRQAGHGDLPLTLALAGEHNVRNALAAVAVARLLGLPDAAIQQALAGFGGAGRRLQAYGLLPCAGGGQYTLLDDYGHHPAELAAVLAAARGAWPGRRLVAVFQPHRYSRTRDCLDGFAAVLRRFDAVLLTEVYAAGEAPLPGADGAALAARVPGARFVPHLQDLAAAVRETARDGDVVLTLGAGSITRLAAELMPAELQAPMEESA